MVTRFRILGLLWALAFSVGAMEKPKQGGTLTMAIQRDVALMNPLVTTRSTEQSIRDLMFESLLAIDAGGNIQPNLALSWKVSSDGKLYTFQLRKGVKFHNDLEMTAEDAKFAIEYSMNPKNGAFGYLFLTEVDRVEAPDRYTLKIRMKNPTAPFLASLTSIQAFSVIPKGSLKDGLEKPTRYPPGTGPFKFVEWQPQQRIVFERYDEYWGHKALVDRLVVRPTADPTVRFLALRTGEVDMIERTPYEWVKQIVEGKVKGIHFAEASHAGFRRIVFNVAAEPFQDKRIRQAIAHVIDRKQILDAAFLGFGSPSNQKYPRGVLWHFEGIPSLRRDPDRARALLKEAGYAGQPLELMAQRGEEAEPTALQPQLKTIGIDVRITVLDSSTYGARHRKGDFGFYFGGSDFRPDPSLTYQTDLLCEPNAARRSNNSSGYCDKEMDALLKTAGTEMNQEKRKALFKQVVSKLVEDVPELHIGFVPRFFTFRDYVKGFTTDGEGGFRPWDGGLNHTWLDK